MRRSLALLLVLLVCAAPVLAQTAEVTTKAPNFLTEFDITFWQTLPWAAFWGYALGSQLARGGEVNMSPVISAALVVSAANAFFQARRATAAAHE